MDTPRKRLYIVSFGDSRKYRFEYTEPAGTTDLCKPEPFRNVEETLSRYLADRFPGKSFAFLTSAKATEISPAHAAQYASYPELDDKAIGEIEKVLSKEAEDVESLRELNRNAPFSAIDPDAE